MPLVTVTTLAKLTIIVKLNLYIAKIIWYK
jgi:hypothetical protein